MTPLDAQCVLNPKTDDGSTMRYSPISKDGMLSSRRTHSEGPRQPPTSAALVTTLVRIFAGLYALEKGKYRTCSRKRQWAVLELFVDDEVSACHIRAVS
jgi:hypothetical protein